MDYLSYRRPGAGPVLLAGPYDLLSERSYRLPLVFDCTGAGLDAVPWLRRAPRGHVEAEGWAAARNVIVSRRNSSPHGSLHKHAPALDHPPNAEPRQSEELIPVSAADSASSRRR